MLFDVRFAPIKKWGEFNLEFIISCQGIPFATNCMQARRGEFSDLVAVHVLLIHERLGVRDCSEVLQRRA